MKLARRFTSVFSVVSCIFFIGFLGLNALHFRPIISLINSKINAKLKSDDTGFNQVKLSGGRFSFSFKSGVELYLYDVKFDQLIGTTEKRLSAEFERVLVAVSLYPLIRGQLEPNLLIVENGNVKFYDKNNSINEIEKNPVLSKQRLAINRINDFTDFKVKFKNILFSHSGVEPKKIKQFKMNSLSMVFQVKNLAGLLKDLEFAVQGQDSQRHFKPAFLNIKDIKSQLAGGQFSGDLLFDGRKLPASLSLVLQVGHLDFGAVIGSLGMVSGLSGGLLNGMIHLQGQGKNKKELIADLSGKTSLALQRAKFYPEIKNPLIASIIKLLVGGDNKQGMTLNCLISSFKGEKGTFISQALVLDSASSFVLGAGSIDVVNNTINLVITPQGRALNLSSLVTPFKISGKLSDPIVFPDAKSTLWTVGKYLLGSVTGVGLVAVLGSAVADNVANSVSDVCKSTLDKINRLQATSL
ncbi:putative protein involved in outer membrane biogenesis [Piscirickettsia salmonis]|uniref:AsmA-like family protein n=1 Tax=Piscirickettsia salmonis TaxID=1238 RepID=A0A1L6TEC1_PISSA|nr:AsmA-like C-terminal region-containing protein [Piscirickettsia salmonis]AKP72761.1 hypothetical protein PSLF89_639 [Piscirickettsia salmonis LF-89 = ATCC VR-1361]ALB23732.1 asmA-like family protein [Piscirickettsia salmonis]ALY03583.1 hypothetical protein AWE47_12600 [Piscirickettsia salmonis]AMA43148.1 hypothetical protein AWJ11_12830 [Piscirickettsia salmonis]AOS35619.1 hypothetical protein AVM72_09955 [Piscirickettsia salmonis]